MTNDELEAVRARAEAATAGPWVHSGGYGDIPPGKMRRIGDGKDNFIFLYAAVGDDKLHAMAIRDAAFIAHARTDIPALLDALTRAEAHAERLASLMGEMFESGTVEVAFAGNPIPCDDLERRIRSALSAYRGEMK